jgi:hypothetical protein
MARRSGEIRLLVLCHPCFSLARNAVARFNEVVSWTERPIPPSGCSSDTSLAKGETLYFDGSSLRRYGGRAEQFGRLGPRRQCQQGSDASLMDAGPNDTSSIECYKLSALCIVSSTIGEDELWFEFCDDE